MLQNSKTIFLGLLSFIALVVINIFVFNHYSSFLPARNNLVVTQLFLNVGILFIVLSTGYYKEIINPFAFIGLFLMQWGISFLRISDTQKVFSPLSLSIGVITMVSFCIGIFLAKTFLFKKRAFFNNRTQYFLFLGFFYSGVLVFLLEIQRAGLFPFLAIIKTQDSQVYNKVNEIMIPLLHYLVLFHSILPILAIVLYQRGVLKLSSVWIFSLISAFIILNYLSRQSILLLILSIFLYVNYRKRINVGRVLFSICIFIVLFIYFGTLRSHTTTIEDTNTFLKFYANISLNTSLFDTYFTLYSSLNFNTFNTIVNKAYADSYYGLGIYTFKPVISLLFIDRIGLVNYPGQFNSFERVATFMVDPFLDFGFIGVVFINLWYGWLSGIIFNSYEQKKGMLSVINWTVIAFCLVMLPFVNYFNNFLIWALLFFINLFASKEENSLK